ncbi:MAG: hypothetical protein A2Z18_07720 [Armatimonadetes bacterium RBG_16_58_9]|nr:MAG: hypothetical protein A2Z18_07720 [Armatimonadetes bacterium RBG_16_58_9]
MNVHRTLLLTAFLALVPVLGLAAAPSQAPVFGDDPRLDRAVTYDAKGITLTQVCADLTRKTGVILAAGTDDADWTVYDRKIIAHVNEMKLRDLMRETASIVRFDWAREGESGDWTYRLHQTDEQRREEQSLRSAAEDAATRKFREKRKNALSDLVNLGSLSEEDARKLKTTDPWRYVLATEPLGAGIARFLTSVPEAGNAFVQGLEVGLPVSRLAPDLQATVRGIAESYDSLTQSIGVSEDHSDLLARFDRLQITINRSRTRSGDDVLSESLLGSISIGAGSEQFDVPLFDPSSAVGRAFGTAIVDLRSGVSREEVAARLQETMKQAVGVNAGPNRTPSRDTSSDPGLRKSIRLFEVDVNATLPMTLQSLAINAKLNVISDYFPGNATTILHGERPLGEQLEVISTAFDSNWEKSGNVVRFRDKQWFRKRAWEVAEAWIQYWISRAKVNEGLLLEDFVQIGNLSDDQIDHAILTNRHLAGYGAGEAARNRSILRFYALLTEDQRGKLGASSLPVSSLHDGQWEALRKALSSKGAAYVAAEKGSQTIRLTYSDKSVGEYQFLFHPGNGQPPIVFKLTSGVIYEPADETGLPGAR